MKKNIITILLAIVAMAGQAKDFIWKNPSAFMGNINGYLTDTCLTAQDQYKNLLDYFRIRY